MIRIHQDGNDLFLIMEDDTKVKVPDFSINVNLQVTAALENGLIVPVGTAISVARAEREYWKMLAEKRGEDLANLRSGG
jgi:hypothetical protein